MRSLGLRYARWVRSAVWFSLAAVVAATLACDRDSPARAELPDRATEAQTEARADARDPVPQSDPLLGRTMPAWRVAQWSHTEPLDLADLRGKVVVVRFWTDTCPYCRASMPALQTLAEAFADAPVVFVGLYHEKPRGRPDAWQGAVATADAWGVTFPIGHDDGWATLDTWWLRTRERAATSSTIVLGKTGEVIHVHPGPVYFPSDDEADARPNADFVALREAIARGIADD